MINSQNYTYTCIYRIPSPKQTILIPRTPYTLDYNLWTQNECKQSKEIHICEDVIHAKCNLRNISSCEFARIEYRYTDIVETRNAVLIASNRPTELIEQCEQEITKHIIKHNAQIQSRCLLIIENRGCNPSQSTYEHIFQIYNKTPFQKPIPPKYQIKQIKNLGLKKIKERIQTMAETPLHQSPEYHATQTSITGLIIIVIAVMSITAYSGKESSTLDEDIHTNNKSIKV